MAHKHFFDEGQITVLKEILKAEGFGPLFDNLSEDCEQEIEEYLLTNQESRELAKSAADGDLDALEKLRTSARNHFVFIAQEYGYVVEQVL